MPGASTSVRRFGLFGTQRALQVDVLQITPAQCVAAAAAGGEGAANRTSATTRTKPPQVPELHTVQYWFEEPVLDGSEGSTGLRGLVRRELDWETPLGSGEEGLPGAGKATAESLSDSAALSDVALSPDPMSVAPLRADPEDPSILWAAEVIDLRFRYYDGTAWGTQWNSLERKSLPVAIEVTLKVKSGEAPRPTPRPPEDVLEELAADLGMPGDQSGQTHRLLVCLPSTGLARPAKKADEGLASILDEGAFPLLPEFEPLVPPSPPPRPSWAPPPPPGPAAPLTPRGPAPGAGGRKSLEEMLQDQWIRTGR
jgi:hypothetical protein